MHLWRPGQPGSFKNYVFNKIDVIRFLIICTIYPRHSTSMGWHLLVHRACTKRSHHQCLIFSSPRGSVKPIPLDSPKWSRLLSLHNKRTTARARCRVYSAAFTEAFPTLKAWHHLGRTPKETGTDFFCGLTTSSVLDHSCSDLLWFWRQRDRRWVACIRQHWVQSEPTMQWTTNNFHIGQGFVVIQWSESGVEYTEWYHSRARHIFLDTAFNEWSLILARTRYPLQCCSYTTIWHFYA